MYNNVKTKRIFHPQKSKVIRHYSDHLHSVLRETMNQGSNNLKNKKYK